MTWTADTDDDHLVPMGDPLPVGCLQVLFFTAVVLALFGLVWLWMLPG